MRARWGVALVLEGMIARCSADKHQKDGTVGIERYDTHMPLANAFVYSVAQTLCLFGAPNFPDWSFIVSSWLRVPPAFPLSGHCTRIPGRTVRGDLQTVVPA